VNRESPSRIEWAWLAALIGLFFLLALATYSHLGEDAFISFRYTRNLARGWGLVYNRGEFVEGYSNLLWVLVLTPFEWIGARLHVAARILSTLSFAGLVVLAWWMALRLANGRDRWWAAWWLPVALVVEPYLHYHDDRGLETVFYAALLGAALFVIGGGGRLWVAGLLAGLAAWTRPEGIGFALALAPAVYLDSQEDDGFRARGSEWTAVASYLAWPIGFFVLQMLFRRFYYDAWLPNTVVAKRPSGGGLGEIAALSGSHAGVPLLGFAGLIAGLGPRRFRPLAVGGLATWLAAAAFQIKAGTLLNVGFRYMIPILVPSVVGLWFLVCLFAERAAKRTVAGKSSLAAPLLAGVFLVLVPLQVYTSGEGYFRGNTDAPRSRFLARLFDAGTWNLAERLRWYFHDPVFINAQAGLWVRENLPSEAVLAADQVGQFGYYAGPDQTIIDLLGLMDAAVARDGLSAAYLRKRAPAYIVVETHRDTTFWPRDWRLRPHVQALWPVFDHPAFREMYRPRWMLNPRGDVMQVGYMVYIRSGLDRGEEMEAISVGPTPEQFERWWRVK